MTHRHAYAQVPIHPDSMLMRSGCISCGRALVPRISDGCVTCPACGDGLAGWRTDFVGTWHGVHQCGVPWSGRVKAVRR